MPTANDGADSSRPETNCDDAEASIRTVPPRTEPAACRVNGSASPSIATPSVRRASSTVSIGRRRAAGSPSKVMSPVPVAASAGRNRMTVPASPQSIRAGPVSGAGVTRQVVASTSSMPAPSARRPSAISWVSRLRRAPCRMLGAVAWAARISARLVNDFEPGTRTVADSGPLTVGAVQCMDVPDSVGGAGVTCT